jgi:hypothetical protein
MTETTRTTRLVAVSLAAVVATTLCLGGTTAFAQARTERLADKDVKTLIDQVDEGRDKFEGNLDGQFKGSTIRNANGETKVAGALQDYQDSTQKLKSRFTADYSASAEVTTVLKQSGAIDAFMQRQPATMEGRSEWDRQAANVKRLAEAYGATFPLPDGAAVRRMNDKETAAAAGSMGAAADRVKSDIDKLPNPDKDAGKKEIELLIKQAGVVKSRTGDGQPATNEMRQLVEQAAKVDAFITAHPLPTMANWQAVQASLVKLRQAFGLTQ